MAEPKRTRAAASTPPSAVVRVSVPLDAGTHARLCAAAALEQRDRSALAAEILTTALRGMVTIIDKRKGDGPASSDSEGIGADAA